MAASQQTGVNHEDGMNIGKDSSALVGFHGVTPVDQHAAVVTQSIVAVSVSGVVGFSSSAAISHLLTCLNQVVACLRDKGLIAT